MLCILSGFLRDSVIERDHLFLGGITSSCSCFRPLAFLLSREGLFDALKRFEQFANTLQHSTTCKFVLVLPVTMDHSEDVICQVNIIEGLYHLGELGCMLRVEETGQ